tara:strand:+ start:1984 stop:3288 length:1305 start_codon:yes stop_codon:yes gene_type:complete
MSNQNTTVETVDMDINNILNLGDSVMLPATGDKGGSTPAAKPSMFSRNTVDLSFLDKKDDEDSEKNKPSAAASNDKPDGNSDSKPALPSFEPGEINEILDTASVEEDGSKTGRPKMDKQGLVELTNKLIEKGLIAPFTNDKGEDEDINKYSLKDFEELFEANEKDKTRKTGTAVAEQFFQSLPPEFQYAHEYVQNGGRDLKSLFRSLAQVEEVRQMDPKNEGEAKHIVRSYLQATQPDWTPEEIEEEIVGWDDRNELEAKAQKFKPKLNKLTEEQVAYQLQNQEKMREQQNQQAQIYMDNVYKTLEPGELNGLKLDRKTQNLLFSGLVQPNYPSASGNQTNLLGHLLEKYQYIEPNHGLLAQALWLLADEDGYKAKVREVVKKEVTADTVRKLKSEETRKLASHTPDDDTDTRSQKSSSGYKIPRPNGGGFFKR